MTKNVFPILAYDSFNQNYVDNGTGFLIDNNGNFITAAHVINDVQNNYVAVIDEKRYDITIGSIEYLNRDEQKPPLYKDLAFGKIEIDFNIEPFEFLDEIEEGEIYGVHGYSNMPMNHNVKSTTTLEDLNEEEPLDPDLEILPVYYKVNYECIKATIERVIDEELVEFTNCFTIRVEGMHPKGLSGGPVMLGNKLAGILIAMNT